MNETKTIMKSLLNDTAVLMELQYLPPVGSIMKMVEVGKVIFEQHEHYTKRTYRNRCQILAANGILNLSIPLQKGKHQQLPIRKVGISYADNWQVQHWRSIKSAYGRAPFFEYYGEEVKEIFDKKHPFLFDLNLELFQLIIELMQLEIEVDFSKTYEKTPAEGIFDGRNSILPKKNNEAISFQKYPQVFEDKHGFVPNLSILDLLFCYGTQAYQVLS